MSVPTGLYTKPNSAYNPIMTVQTLSSQPPKIQLPSVKKKMNIESIVQNKPVPSPPSSFSSFSSSISNGLPSPLAQTTTLQTFESKPLPANLSTMFNDSGNKSSKTVKIDLPPVPTSPNLQLLFSPVPTPITSTISPPMPSPVPTPITSTISSSITSSISSPTSSTNVQRRNQAQVPLRAGPIIITSPRQVAASPSQMARQTPIIKLPPQSPTNTFQPKAQTPTIPITSPKSITPPKPIIPITPPKSIMPPTSPIIQLPPMTSPKPINQFKPTPSMIVPTSPIKRLITPMTPVRKPMTPQLSTPSLASYSLTPSLASPKQSKVMVSPSASPMQNYQYKGDNPWMWNNNFTGQNATVGGYLFHPPTDNGLIAPVPTSNNVGLMTTRKINNNVNVVEEKEKHPIYSLFIKYDDRHEISNMKNHANNIAEAIRSSTKQFSTTYRQLPNIRGFVTREQFDVCLAIYENNQVFHQDQLDENLDKELASKYLTHLEHWFMCIIEPRPLDADDVDDWRRREQSKLVNNYSSFCDKLLYSYIKPLSTENRTFIANQLRSIKIS